MPTNITPNRPGGTLSARAKAAWAVLKGDGYPQPLEWYDKLYPLVSTGYSQYAEMAVDKVEREYKSTGDPDERRREARQWMRHYAIQAGKDGDIQPWLANFLIEWWVARKKGRI